jgi:hypothetical protein
MFSDIGKAQTEAYYKELGTVLAASVGKQSDFSAGHWYVVHPMTWWDVKGHSTRALLDIGLWIEVIWPNEFFIRNVNQVLGFRKARKETLEQVVHELERNGRGTRW